MAGQGQDCNSRTGPRPIRKVLGNVRQRRWIMRRIRANLKTDYQRNGRLGLCKDGCVGRKTVGNLQKELQNGDLGKNNSTKLGKPPGNESEWTTQSKGLNGDSWTRYSQPATDCHDKGLVDAVRNSPLCGICRERVEHIKFSSPSAPTKI